jgi:plasmid maintenance system antidote protein VapI
MRKKENKGVPEKIKRYLEDNGTKQIWLAEKSGISQAHISNVLANRVLLTDDVLDKINNVLGTDFKLS